jgi:hypothetical protein
MVTPLKIFSSLFIFFSVFSSSAQDFGGNPSSIQWQQVNSPQSRIIFPKGLDSPAARISNIISYLNNSTQNTIGSRQRKINLVLQNQTTISNGYVNLGPFRSEFFLTPLQNSFELGSLPWPDQLAIHEFRHVQQYNNFDVGLSHLLKIFFGDEGQAIINNAAIPNWFFEGDAVYNETSVSMQGRGRLPFFFKDYRSLWKAGKNYNWMKLRNGSFRDFIPDHYALGYLLVAYGREKYGDQFWKNVTHDAAAGKGLFYPFQKAIKKYAGVDYVTFRNDAMNFFKGIFNTGKVKEEKNHGVTDEEYPAFIDDNSVVFVNSSYRRVHAFVIRNGNETKRIRIKDLSLDNHFSYRNGKIVYASYQPDRRWGNRDYSELQVLDVNTGSQTTVTHQSKYFAPDINEDGSKIVAVQVGPNGNSSLHVINAANGELIKALQNPQHFFYTYPKFYGNNIISAVRNSKGEMALAMIDAGTGKTEYLTPFSFNVIGFPSVTGDTVYFSAMHAHEDRLFALNLKNKNIFLLGASPNGTGSYQPSVSGKKIIWTTFTAEGYRLQQSDINSVEWKAVSENEFAQAANGFGITAINRSPAHLSSVKQEQLPVTTYRKSFSLLNFHSIEPLVDDPEYTLTLVSENILNTLQSQVSFTYNRAEQWKRIGFSAIYGGFFPYLTAGADYTIDRRGRYHGKTIYWNELEPHGGFNIPLNLSKGRSIAFMNIGSSYVYNQSDYKGVYKDTLGRLSYSYLSNFFTISHQVQKAKQHIYPRFAQTLALSYKSALSTYKGSQFVANANFYLPGFLTNHNIVLNAAYLYRDTLGRLNFSSGFPFSRGYEAENLHEMIKWGVNYHLPLLYPDAGIANIVYLLRLRATLFYDHTHVNDFYTNRRVFKADFRSTGGELYFDTKWWNEASVTFGVRYSYLLDNDLFGATGKNRWEIILPVNIFNQ